MSRPSYRTPNRERARPILRYGNDTLHRRLFTCRWCGFVVDRKRNTGETTVENSYRLYRVPSEPAKYGTELKSVLGGPDNVVVGRSLNADGTVRAVKHIFAPNVSGGCPLCGKAN